MVKTIHVNIGSSTCQIICFDGVTQVKTGAMCIPMNVDELMSAIKKTNAKIIYFYGSIGYALRKSSYHISISSEGYLNMPLEFNKEVPWSLCASNLFLLNEFIKDDKSDCVYVYRIRGGKPMQWEPIEISWKHEIQRLISESLKKEAIVVDVGGRSVSILFQNGKIQKNKKIVSNKLADETLGKKLVHFVKEHVQDRETFIFVGITGNTRYFEKADIVRSIFKNEGFTRCIVHSLSCNIEAFAEQQSFLRANGISDKSVELQTFISRLQF